MPCRSSFPLRWRAAHPGPHLQSPPRHHRSGIPSIPSAPLPGNATCFHSEQVGLIPSAPSCAMAADGPHRDPSRTPGNYAADYSGGAIGALSRPTLTSNPPSATRWESRRSRACALSSASASREARGRNVEYTPAGDCLPAGAAGARRRGAAGAAAGEDEAVVLRHVRLTALRILREEGLYAPLLSRLAGGTSRSSCSTNAGRWRGAVFFSKEYGRLCQTAQAQALLEK